MRNGGQRTMRIYKRLWLQARPYWLHIAGIFLLDLLATPLALLKPFPLKIAVDNVVGSSALPKVPLAFFSRQKRNRGLHLSHSRRCSLYSMDHDLWFPAFYIRPNDAGDDVLRYRAH